MNTNLEQLGQLGIELAKRVGAHIPDFNDPEIQKLCQKILEDNKDIRNEFSFVDCGGNKRFYDIDKIFSDGYTTSFDLIKKDNL